MMARPSVSARTECCVLLSTIAATPKRATCVTRVTAGLRDQDHDAQSWS